MSRDVFPFMQNIMLNVFFPRPSSEDWRGVQFPGKPYYRFLNLITRYSQAVGLMQTLAMLLFLKLFTSLWGWTRLGPFAHFSPGLGLSVSGKTSTSKWFVNFCIACIRLLLRDSDLKRWKYDKWVPLSLWKIGNFPRARMGRGTVWCQFPI